MSTLTVPNPLFLKNEIELNKALVNNTSNYLLSAFCDNSVRSFAFGFENKTDRKESSFSTAAISDAHANLKLRLHCYGYFLINTHQQWK